MKRIVLLFLLLLPNTSNADEGLKLSCTNMLSEFGRNYEPLIFKLEVTGFHYFDKISKKFKTIPANELEFGENRFTVKFPEYEFGFQRIIFAGETVPTITMSKYDYINNRFIDHYKCESERVYIDQII